MNNEVRVVREESHTRDQSKTTTLSKLQSRIKRVMYFCSEDRNCLLNSAEHAFRDEFDRHLAILPGQVYSLDEQCRQQYGNTSFYCRVRFSSFLTKEHYYPWIFLTRICNHKNSLFRILVRNYFIDNLMRV